ncbi:MAG: hypothetical protein HZA54_14480, partial [Planctomycetes bacterium]|nr:hypothetical protein [Planctomycetota bacterium]
MDRSPHLPPDDLPDPVLPAGLEQALRGLIAAPPVPAALDRGIAARARLRLAALARRPAVRRGAT